MLLVMNPGQGDEEAFPLSIGRATIGRTRDNDISCVHKSLSRTHAQLEFDGDRVRIRDLASKNGVFVHGERVTEAELFEGDTFRCGDITFLVERGTKPELRTSEPRMSPVAQTLPSPLALEQALKGRPTRLASAAAVPQDEDRYKEKLFVLVRASELLVGELSVERLLDEVVVLAAQVLDGDRLALLTLDEDTLAMRPRVVKTFVGGAPRPFSQRVVDWVVDHGSPVSFGDVSRDRSLPGDPRPDAGVRAAVAVPLNPGGGTIGVFYVDSVSRAECFRPDDVALLRALANLAAVALESAARRRGESEAPGSRR